MSSRFDVPLMGCGKNAEGECCSLRPDPTVANPCPLFFKQHAHCVLSTSTLAQARALARRNGGTLASDEKTFALSRGVLSSIVPTRVTPNHANYLYDELTVKIAQDLYWMIVCGAWNKQTDRNVLFIGEPGVGKSVMARDIAALLHAQVVTRPVEAGSLESKSQDEQAFVVDNPNMEPGTSHVQIVYVGESLLQHSHVGVSGQVIDGLLDELTQFPGITILVFDDLDATFPTRSAVSRESDAVFQPTLQLLEEGRYNNVVCIGTTNNPERLDPAIKSRFSVHTHLIPEPSPFRRRMIAANMALQCGFTFSEPLGREIGEGKFHLRIIKQAFSGLVSNQSTVERGQLFRDASIFGTCRPSSFAREHHPPLAALSSNGSFSSSSASSSAHAGSRTSSPSNATSRMALGVSNSSLARSMASIKSTKQRVQAKNVPSNRSLKASPTSQKAVPANPTRKRPTKHPAEQTNMLRSGTKTKKKTKKKKKKTKATGSRQTGSLNTKQESSAAAIEAMFGTVFFLFVHVRVCVCVFTKHKLLACLLPSFLFKNFVLCVCASE